MQKTLVFTFVAVMLCACGGNKKQQEMNNISNKEKAVALLKSIETGASEPIAYVNAENYKQHNLTVADGLDGLGAALAAMAEQGIKMEYFTIHKILGCGNFILAVSEGAFAGQPTSYYDLFRIENGKIAEHWDVMETIAPKSEWKHQNGKYNFPK
jgi:predicted SnoaL-like aldol condensation-catalyzing enzyme